MGRPGTKGARLASGHGLNRDEVATRTSCSVTHGLTMNADAQAGHRRAKFEIDLHAEIFSLDKHRLGKNDENGSELSLSLTHTLQATPAAMTPLAK